MLKSLLPSDYPKFWLKRGIAARLLQPLGNLYAGLGILREMSTQQVAVDIPVVCVGNLSIGGVGKTPIVSALATALQSQGVAVHILAHGYGGKMTQATRVNPKHHCAGDVGDEALLHAQTAPTWIGRDRAIAARLAVEAGADMIILDDGWQNPRLKKDMVIAVVNADDPFGNGLLLPAGPLRLKPAALWSADAVVAVGEILHSVLEPFHPVHGRRVSSWRKPFAADGAVFAFCGLGRSGQFMKSVEKLCAESGVELSGIKTYPDHYPWNRETLAEITEAAGSARLVTSAKDWQRLPEDWQQKVGIIDLNIAWAIPDKFTELCQKIGNLTKK